MVRWVRLQQHYLTLVILSIFYAASNIKLVLEAAPPQNSSYTATYHPSRKLSKLDEPDMWDTALEVGTNSSVKYSCESFNMDEQRQDDQLEPIHNRSVPIQDVALNTYRERWTVEKGSGRWSGRSALATRHDDEFYSTLFIRFDTFKWF